MSKQSIRRNMDILAQHDNLDDFIAALRTMDRSRQDPLGRSPLLHMEMILYVARAEKRRPELAKTPARAAQADRRHRRGHAEEQRRRATR